jgi:hypothetical protein
MSHCNPASTVSINLSNVAGAPFSPNDSKKVVYLGHVISEAGIANDPERTKNCRIMASTNECQRITVIYGILWV